MYRVSYCIFLGRIVILCCSLVWFGLVPSGCLFCVFLCPSDRSLPKLTGIDLDISAIVAQRYGMCYVPEKTHKA